MSLAIRKLYEHVYKLLRRIHSDDALTHPIPVKPTVTESDKAATVWSDLDQLAAEIGASWPDDLSAADAVHEDRRDL